jgi:hypothetical protein
MEELMKQGCDGITYTGGTLGGIDGGGWEGKGWAGEITDTQGLITESD